LGNDLSFPKRMPIFFMSVILSLMIKAGTTDLKTSIGVSEFEAPAGFRPVCNQIYFLPGRITKKH
jgi:hypothetical protein